MSKLISSEVIEIFKEQGLTVSEELAVNAVRAVFKVLMVTIPKVSVGLGIIIGPIIDRYEPMILAMLDKIDGKDSPDY